MQERLTNIKNLTKLPAFDTEWEINVPYSFIDLGIVIEYLAGDTRTKVGNGGVVMAGVMPAAYGYILRTTDAHGEEIDMYLATMPNPDATVYVIDQVNPVTSFFDEHKVMLGFGSVEEASHIYTSVFGDGSGKERLGAITLFTPDVFTTWLTMDGASLRPASSFKLEGVRTFEVSGITPVARPDQNSPAPRDEAGGVEIPLPALNNGPKLVTTSSKEGCFDYHFNLFSALDVVVWSNAIDTACRVLALASKNDTFHIHIASPGGSVFLMGRLISAIDCTDAKVITYAQGCVASAATSIWAAGHERHILRGAYFMQHMSSQLLMGKTTDIQAKSKFSMEYITSRLERLADIGLFTVDEVADMVDKSADVFISGREAVTRMGKVSVRSK